MSSNPTVTNARNFSNSWRCARVEDFFIWNQRTNWQPLHLPYVGGRPRTTTGPGRRGIPERRRPNAAAEQPAIVARRPHPETTRRRAGAHRTARIRSPDQTVKATDFESLLRRLLDARIDFIVVGGVAAVVHGSARATFDLDIVYSRANANVARIVDALSPIGPYLRGVPRGLPFSFDADTIDRGLNFTLETSLGDLDLLGEITGGGRYEDLLPFSDSRDQRRPFPPSSPTARR